MKGSLGVEVDDPYTGSKIRYVVLDQSVSDVDLEDLRQVVDPSTLIYVVAPLARLGNLPLAAVYIRRSLHADEQYLAPAEAMKRLSRNAVIRSAETDADRRFAAEQLEIALTKGNQSIGLSTSWVKQPAAVFERMLADGIWHALVCCSGDDRLGHITWEANWTNDVSQQSMPRIVDAAPAKGFDSIGCATVLTGYLLDLLKRDHNEVLGEVTCLGFHRPTELLAVLGEQGWSVDHALAIVNRFSDSAS